MFEIIKNAPPPVEMRGGRYKIYNFDLMEVGDAFDAPRDMGKGSGNQDKRQASINSCSRLWAKRYNPTAKFTVRLYDEHTVRCHRIA